ncbi:DoxX family protein [Methylomonas sp. 11b]|uniref:DoxX family protein n=1 Tax=Methylomonas sp. 11b TaxID=1168169 RepID=UPI00047AB864|nr:DoxX family protein [Methylomonas sp. 11b]
MNTKNICKLIAPFYQANGRVYRFAILLDKLAPLGNSILRCWVAYAFWVSGLLKLQSWDSTLYLFENEYAVPLLSAEFAAMLGTAVELAGPLLLAIGLFGRGAAVLMFLFNLVAVISYPDLGAAGIEQHKVWGIMLLVCMLQGPGKLSLDAWIKLCLFPPQNERVARADNRESK